MSTLITIFEPMLPFSIIINALPPPADIYSCTISFSSVHVFYKAARIPYFALLFFNPRALEGLHA